MNKTSFNTARWGLKTGRPATIQPRIYASKQPTLLEMVSLMDWRWFVPETVGLLAFIVVIQMGVVGNLRVSDSIIHPYWLAVLLMSCQYGMMGGLFATVSSTLIYSALGMPQQSAAQDFYEYAGLAAAQPAGWLASALILGGLRSLHIHNNGILQRDMDESLLAAETLATGLEQAATEIHYLEQRVAAEPATITGLTRQLALLDVTDLGASVQTFANLIQIATGARGLTIYRCRDGAFYPLVHIESDERVSVANAPPLPQMVVERLVRSDLDRAAASAPEAKISAQVILASPIRVDNTTQLLGAVVCHTVRLGQNHREAATRLDYLTRAMARFLSQRMDAGHWSERDD